MKRIKTFQRLHMKVGLKCGMNSILFIGIGYGYTFIVLQLLNHLLTKLRYRKFKLAILQKYKLI